MSLSGPNQVFCCAHHRESGRRADDAIAEVWHESVIVKRKAAASRGHERLGHALSAAAVRSHLSEERPFAKPPSAYHSSRDPQDNLRLSHSS
jgi:hypothetical protein